MYNKTVVLRRKSNNESGGTRGRVVKDATL